MSKAFPAARLRARRAPPSWYAGCPEPGGPPPPRGALFSIRRPHRILFALGLVAGAAVPTAAAATTSDTLTFRPSLQFEYWDSTGHEPLEVAPVRVTYQGETEWLRAPMGDRLLDHPDPWIANHHGRSHDVEMVGDYNRSDLVRYGIHYQAQRPQTMYPRLGARLEYATGRKRTLYGIQMEQPLLPTARFVFGWSAVRRTEHPELQLVDDAENSLALLLDRTDYRDYFERE